MSNLNTELLTNLFGQTIMDAFSHQTISEIIVNADGQIWLEGEKSQGTMQQAGKCHSDDLLHAFGLLAEYRGVYLNQNHPDMCIDLPNALPFKGARLTALIPPIVKAPCMTIRKHLKCEDISLTSYVENNMALFPFLLVWNSVCIRVTMQLPESKCRAFNERLNHPFRYKQS